jgi:hypothetical protein
LRELEQKDAINLYPMIVEDRPHLFAESIVFVTENGIKKQLDIIAAIERTIALPAYQESVLAYGPDSAKFKPQASGVFFGYDFHLSDEGPKLIEINSNAGGALINSLIFRHQTVCYDSAKPELSAPAVHLEPLFFEMFLDEWRAERGQQRLCAIAIVDDNPTSQYMLPEFILFKKLFEEHDIHTVICDPSELVFHDQALWHGTQRIDLVYNRLTDFGLQATENKPLLEAGLPFVGATREQLVELVILGRLAPAVGQLAVEFEGHLAEAFGDDPGAGESGGDFGGGFVIDVDAGLGTSLQRGQLAEDVGAADGLLLAPADCESE